MGLACEMTVLPFVLNILLSLARLKTKARSMKVEKGTTSRRQLSLLPLVYIKT